MPTNRYSHSVVWGALFSAELTREQAFTSEVYIGEDTLFFYQLLDHVNVFVFIDERYYYYRIHDNSLAHAEFHIKQIDEVKAWEMVIELFADRPGSFTDEFRAALGIRCRKNYINAIRGGYHNKTVLMELYKKALQNYHYVLKSKGLSAKSKIAFSLFLAMPRLYAKRPG